MKKVVAAGIKQILEFDSRKEMYIYIGKLRTSKIEHKCIWNKDVNEGKVQLCIMKAYNNSPLIED